MTGVKRGPGQSRNPRKEGLPSAVDDQECVERVLRPLLRPIWRLCAARVHGSRLLEAISRVLTRVPRVRSGGQKWSLLAIFPD